MGKLFVCLFIGKLLIFTIQKFSSSNIRWGFLQRLIECDFCLGVWIFSLLAITLDLNIYIEWVEIWAVVHVFTGVTLSFAMHLWSAGWKALYNITIIE